MRLDKQTAFKLRLQGKSYNEISKALGIPKSTLSDWFRSFELPEEAYTRLRKRVSETSKASLIKHNKLQTDLAEQRVASLDCPSMRDVGTKEGSFGVASTSATLDPVLGQGQYGPA